MPPLILPAADTASLVATLRERARELERPCIVALDGRSGAGKSTLAAKLSQELDAGLLPGDDFFAGGVHVRRDAARDRARDCIAWRRQRPVLEALRAGRDASYFAFDWDTFDGRIRVEQSQLPARALILFEGVYSARPELSDLTDLRVLLRVSETTRLARLLAREGTISAWERQWHEAEDWYFADVAPPSAFDVIVDE